MTPNRTRRDTPARPLARASATDGSSRSRRRSARGPDDMRTPRSASPDATPPARSTRSRTVEWRPMRRSTSIRDAKVMTAQARIAVGYYDREDVRELLLDALLKELAAQ